MPHENTLDARRAALAVIDVQESFRRRRRVREEEGVLEGDAATA